MKRVMVTAAVLAMVCGVCGVSGQTVSKEREALDAALALYAQGRFAEALGSLRKVQTDFPDGDTQVLAIAKKTEAYQSYLLKDYDTAGKAYEEWLALYGADPECGWLGVWEVQMSLGSVRMLQRNYAAAKTAYENAALSYPMGTKDGVHTPEVMLGPAVKGLLRALEAQNKRAEAARARMTFVEAYARDMSVAKESDLIPTLFAEIDPRLVTVAEYRSFLANTVKSIRAVAENAAFLGQVKSELGKME
jgi:tetratricopeptide (TPR) repeat protein